jgi:CheY-like chemotaxis protein
MIERPYRALPTNQPFATLSFASPRSREPSIAWQGLVFCVACWLVGGSLFQSSLLAQVDDPFGFDAPAAEVPEPVAPTGPVSDEEEESPETDPIVIAVRESNPRTPNDLLRAVKILSDIGRFDLAKTYLERLAAQNLDNPTLIRLQRRFGDALLVRLANTEALEPEGAELANRIFAAVRERVQDPRYAADLVEKLKDPRDRSRALGELRGRTPEVVGALLGQLADDSQAARHGDVQRALVYLDEQAGEPLRGALESPDEAFRQRVLEVIAARPERPSGMYLLPAALRDDSPDDLRKMARAGLKRLWGDVPSPSSAADLLTRRFRQLFSADRETFVDLDRQVWRWDEEQQTVVAQTVSAADYQRLEAHRVARVLRETFPDREEFVVQDLAAELEMLQASVGVNRVLDADMDVVQRALEIEPRLVSEALRFCLRQDREPGAVAATRILSASGTEAELEAGTARFSPLVEALHHRNQLVQAAGLEAIMSIGPRRPFPGSHRFSELLGYFLRSRPTRRALVVHPRADEGRNLVGLLGELGFEAEWTSRGKEGLKRATERPDFEFVLVSDATDSPSATEMAQMLRSSSRSRALPVAIMIRDLPIDLESSATWALEEFAAERGTIGSDALAIPDADELSDVASGQSRIGLESEVRRYRQRQFDRYRRYAEEDPLLLIIPPPRSPESLQLAVRKLMALPGEHRGTQTVSPERRSGRTQAILDWLAEAIDGPMAKQFDLTRLERDVFELLYFPEYAGRASRVLGRFSSPESQQMLADVASQPTLSIRIRQAAAEALREAIQRRGVLLTQESIVRQYDRYNASESLDPETQVVLGAVLDAIEIPLARSVTEVSPAARNDP